MKKVFGILLLFFLAINVVGCQKSHEYDFKKYNSVNANLDTYNSVRVSIKNVQRWDSSAIKENDFDINQRSEEYKDKKIINDILNIVDNVTPITDEKEFESLKTYCDTIKSAGKDPYDYIGFKSVDGDVKRYKCIFSQSRPYVGFINKDNQYYQFRVDDSMYINRLLNSKKLSLDMDDRVVKIFKKNGMNIDYLMGVKKEQLPDSFTANYNTPVVPLYWAQVKAVSNMHDKQNNPADTSVENLVQNVNLKDYLGKKIQVELYAIRECSADTRLPESNYLQKVAVALKKGDDIIGVYYYLDGDYYPRNLNSQTANDLEGIDYIEWLSKNYNYNDSFNKSLKNKSEEDIIKMYYKNVNDRKVLNVSAIKIDDLIKNMMGENPDRDFLLDEDEFLEKVKDDLDNVESMRLLDINRADSKGIVGNSDLFRVKVDAKYKNETKDISGECIYYVSLVKLPGDLGYRIANIMK